MTDLPDKLDARAAYLRRIASGNPVYIDVAEELDEAAAALREKDADIIEINKANFEIVRDLNLEAVEKDADIERLRSGPAGTEQLNAALDEALAELAEARRDTERLDDYFRHHLDHSGQRQYYIESPLGRHWCVMRWKSEPGRFEWDGGEHVDFRDAMDAARASERDEEEKRD
jgi:hypothetical protein